VFHADFAALTQCVNRFVSRQGVDDAYDNALDTISRLEAQLAQYLESQKAVLRCRDIEYFHNKVNAKDRYQIEVPESACKHVPDSYSLSSQKKGYRRYTTAESTSLLNQLCKAEDAKAAAIADTMRRMFARFDAHYNEFASVSAAMSYLDCLMSLALWSSSSDAMCK
jgi:DNA mismatch repair protein MSH6